MNCFDFGNEKSSNVLIQPVDEHDLKLIESEVKIIQELAGDDFHLVAIKIGNWNADLSPWCSPAVFGKEDFGNGGEVSGGRRKD